ncbi:tRNA (adenosine(37)-N6)-threonylcarbamoyltransferase complex ATPase subunit type 1 TsaE [Flavobacterium agricola]|uniref:tRNA threonylcarbamoyladenosine biosynthesis protein TsaE n=1 Tax=Flavobacterium agricola TaxID=2870839 RepID=A0ABY6M2H6_9FLAO|nr:tRNA (adenosine(37)-N6)-threonylcarbamoyltransferase complex ATPase subunit type 1 TsaE [Flavobacterium agricola]UYW02007.1 tRNA (adenosine(37)-N6)-threonylcarbamoyltransferase complex ATPase subunit type 1 TsaE [Flavobacterium agricola]
MEIVYSLEEIDAVAKQIIQNTTNNIILFDAQMGTGKTTLIKALLKNLGVTDATSSPTFSIVNEHVTAENKTFYHFDLYRLNSEEEAYDFGIEEYLYSDHFCFIEWPEKASNLLPKNHTKITIETLPNGKRKLFIKN